MSIFQILLDYFYKGVVLVAASCVNRRDTMRRLLVILIPFSIHCSEVEPPRIPKYLKQRPAKKISALNDKEIDALYHEIAIRSFILHVTGVLDEITPPKPDKKAPRPPFPFKQICDTACPQVGMKKYYTLFGK